MSQIMQKDLERLQYYDDMNGNIPEEKYYRFCDDMEIIKQNIEDLSWSSCLYDERNYRLYLCLKSLYEKVEHDSGLCDLI